MKALAKFIALVLMVPCLFSCKGDDEQPDLTAQPSTLEGDYKGTVIVRPKSIAGADYTNNAVEVRLEPSSRNTLALYTNEQGHLSDKEIFSNFKYTATDKKVVSSDVKNFTFEIFEQNKVKYLVQWFGSLYPIISDVKITVEKSTATYNTESRELSFTYTASAAFKAKASANADVTNQQVDKFTFTYIVTKQ
ncbi:MAG: hypothetical protein LBF79_02250 [Dysgonamonadaceae bacterium]|jgi:hypothetical protein|nr:hypothetical protein [Dysgonamonadaceae bacterium]